MAKPRRTVEDRLEELTDRQRRELIDPVERLFDFDAASSAFASEDERRRAWEAHREELIEEVRQARPGKRPGAYWQYDLDNMMPAADDLGFDSFEAFRRVYGYGWSVASAYLHHIGELAEWEVEAVEASVREIMGADSTETPGGRS